MPSLAGHMLPSERAAIRSAKAAAAAVVREKDAAEAKAKAKADAEAARKQAIADYRHPLAPPKKAGRIAQVRVTPELLEKACSGIRKGLGIESALILAGVSWSGVDRWRKANPAVEQAIKLAERQWEEEIVGILYTKAKQGDVKVGQWLLERRLPGHGWAPVTKNELTGKDGAAIQVISLSKQLLATVAGNGDLEQRGKREPIKVEPA